MSEPVEALIDFTNAIEAAAVNLRRRIQVATKPESQKIPEKETFEVLKWEPNKGQHLHEFETAAKDINPANMWTHAYMVLQRNNADIEHRFHPEGYIHGYWLFKEDRIYRKKLMEKEAGSTG